jgi:23S rRNA (adenine2503-C2)-methyltransferase
MAMVEYQKKTGNRITIEYALLGGVNDGVEHARELIRFLKGIHVYINLIPYNDTDGRYEKPEAESILKFRNVLTTAGFEAEFRHSLGMDIAAACGQLRRKTLANAQPEEPSMPRPVKNNVQTARKVPAPLHKNRKTESSSDGKKRRIDKPESDRYRSGKMKSARPSYRGQSEKDGDTKETRASFGAKTSKAPSKFDASRGKVDKKYKSRTVRDTKKTKEERPGKKKTGK